MAHDHTHVTSILRDAGLVDVTWFTEEHRDRGTAVHMATQFLDEGDLHWDTLDPTVEPRVRQYERFITDVRPEILAVEESVMHRIYGYVGTLDRRLKINGREGVLDIKGVTQSKWHAIQLAGYAGTFDRPMARWNLYLTDRDYRLVERKGRQDWEVFKAAMTLARWRNGLV